MLIERLDNSASSVAEHFDHQVARHAERHSINDGPLVWSYGELGHRSVEISGLLQESGVRSGDRVALMLRNSAAFVAAFYAIARLNCVVAPFNTRYREQELKFYLDGT